jgi:hypothetical protein
VTSRQPKPLRWQYTQGKNTVLRRFDDQPSLHPLWTQQQLQTARTPLWLTIIILIVTTACRPDSVDYDSAAIAKYAAERCASREGRESSAAIEITLIEILPQPCALVYSTRTVLKGADDGTPPSPLGVAAQDSKGRLYSDSEIPGRIAMWDSTGAFIKELGNSGSGPGEMNGWSIPFVARYDRVHVRDNASVWHIFDSQGTFIRRYSARKAGIGPLNTIIFEDGRTLTSMTEFVGAANARFVLADSAGGIEREFGELYEERRGNAESISNAKGGRFWAARGYNGRGLYELEQWTVNGVLERRLIRPAQWLPRDGKKDPEFAPPSIRVIVHADAVGLLLVTVWVGDAVYVDLVDPGAGLILASRPVAPAEVVPVVFFPHSRAGFRASVDSATGLMRIAIVDVGIERALGSREGSR